MRTPGQHADSIDPGDHHLLSRRFTWMLAAAATLLLTQATSADVLAPDTKRISVSVTFTVEGGGHLVAFPSECTTNDLDLNLNPHLRFYPNYDVIDTAKPRAPYKLCGAETALYVLDEATFPKIKGPEEADWRRSEWRIEALDKVPLDKRKDFFASQAGIRATGYTMPGDGAISDRSPLAEVREKVTIAQGKASKVEITYLYTDSSQETFPYQVGQRPQPSRKEARDWMAGLAEPPPGPAPAASGAGAGGSTGSPAASGPAASSQPGAGAASCSGCAVPAEEKGSGFFLAFLLGVSLAVARRGRRVGARELAGVGPGGSSRGLGGRG